MKKLALSMIVKDDSEKDILFRCLTSIAPFVDGIYITLTNKPNHEVSAVAENFGAQTSFYQWDKSFERARNYALDQIPDDYDYIIWCDTDDVWVNAKKIRELVTIMEQQALTSIHLDYNYEIDPETLKVNIVHPRERIVKAGYYRWKGHLHETLIPQREQNAGYYKDVCVNHFPLETTKEANFYRNLEILEETYKAEGEKHDPRTEYYLARNYFDVDEFEKAEKLFIDYLKHSGWDEERAMAENYIGLIYLLKKQYEDAIWHFLMAIKERPDVPTWYVNLAYTYALADKFDEAVHYARLFVNTPQKKTAMVVVPLDDELRYYETIFLIAKGQRKIAEMRDAAEALLQRVPSNQEYKKRLEGIIQLEKLVEMTKNVEYLAATLDSEGEHTKIAALLQSVPDLIADNAVIEQLRQKHLPPITWPTKSIVYWAGRSMEEWTPDSLKTGLGGSETAIVQLAKYWNDLGYRVTVYGNCGAKEGFYNGVEYRNYYRFNRYDTFDTLVIWRAPWELDFKFKANTIFLDLHDVPNPMEFTKKRLANVDKIFVKSQYHRSLLPEVTDEKFVIIPNGYDDSLTKISTKREPYKLIYASSYDRGLEQMLTYGWPVIKKKVPQAELHIYYGWNLFDAVHRNNPERMSWKKKMIELMSQPGVFEHGRVGHEELIKAKASSSVHYYATTFEEIDCISVRESAAVGCIPFTTAYAVFNEKKYVRPTVGDPFSPTTHKELAEDIVAYLGSDRKQFHYMKHIVTEETWKHIAKRWINELKA